MVGVVEGGILKPTHTQGDVMTICCEITVPVKVKRLSDIHNELYSFFFF